MAVGSGLPPFDRDFKYEAPKSSTSSSASTTYDYSNADRAAQLSDEIAKAHRGKYQQLYGGDVPGSVESAQRIRDMVAALAGVLSSPHVRVASESVSSEQSLGGPKYEQEVPTMPQPAAPAADAPEDPMQAHRRRMEERREQERAERQQRADKRKQAEDERRAIAGPAARS